MYVVGAETMNTYASEQLFPDKNFHISHILEEKKIPVTFLRKMRDGYYYSVSKVENGGYAYFFFDRTLDLTSMEYVTDDMTDVYLVGCLYVEQVHKSSDFSAIKTGDSLEEVLKIEPFCYYFKNSGQMESGNNRKNDAAGHKPIICWKMVCNEFICHQRRRACRTVTKPIQKTIN